MNETKKEDLNDQETATDEKTVQATPNADLLDFNVPEYGDRMPFVGETVLFKSNPQDEIAQSNNNDDYIAAIVTRVWSNVCVNLKIIPDCGPMQDRTSVSRIDANPARYHFDFIYEKE